MLTGARRETRHDRGGVRVVPDAWTPHVGGEPALTGRQPGRLRPEDDREVECPPEFPQRRDVADQFDHGGTPRREGADEVVLHVVDQQRGA
jgi:hypothetical protein